MLFVECASCINAGCYCNFISAEDHSSLLGVSVLVKGTYTSTVTDGNGEHMITVSADASTQIIVSFNGYQAKETVIGTKNKIDMVLSHDNRALSQRAVDSGMKTSIYESFVWYNENRIS